MLSDNRKFYDLCRKYKYYYKSYQEIKRLDNIYWSKYIKEAYNEVKSKLDEIESEIIFLIFEELMGGYISADVEEEYIERYGYTSKIPVNFKIKIDGTDGKFANKLLEYIENKNGCYKRGYNLR